MLLTSWAFLLLSSFAFAQGLDCEEPLHPDYCILKTNLRKELPAKPLPVTLDIQIYVSSCWRPHATFRHFDSHTTWQKLALCAVQVHWNLHCIKSKKYNSRVVTWYTKSIFKSLRLKSQKIPSLSLLKLFHFMSYKYLKSMLLSKTGQKEVNF